MGVQILGTTLDRESKLLRRNWTGGPSEFGPGGTISGGSIFFMTGPSSGVGACTGKRVAVDKKSLDGWSLFPFAGVVLLDQGLRNSQLKS